MSTLPFVVPFIRWADVSTLAAGYAMPPRRLYDHELVYVTAGAGEIVIAGQAHAATVDSLFFILPRAWHSFRARPDAALTLIGIHFDWTPQADSLLFPVFRAADEPVDEKLFRAPRLLPEWDSVKMPRLDLKGRLPVRRALEAVITEYAQEDTEARLGAGTLLAAAIVQITREARALRQLEAAMPIGADALRRAKRARQLLEARCETPLTIEEIAAQVGWSADHLRRIFRIALRTSPNKIQTAARLRHAKQLLRHENLSITEVAARCGFPDASHFTRVFKQENGLTPRQFLALAKKA